MFARVTICLFLVVLVHFPAELAAAGTSCDWVSVANDGSTGGECDVSCDPCQGVAQGCACCECDPCLSDDFFRSGQFFVRGWLDQGFTWNPDRPNNRFNGPMTFNDRSNDYQMNQLYLSMGREVRTDGCSWDAGGRIDLLYGSDYFFTTATGLETYEDGSQRWNSQNGPRAGGTAGLYGLAMPQLYAEFSAPFGCGTTFKFGHFYTILGFESVMAPENFFYSHSYVMQYGEPFTHTGMLASYRASQGLTFHGGFTRGWDTWEDPNDTLGFLGGVSWVSRNERSRVNFSLHTGREDALGSNDRTSYSLVFSHKCTCRLTYILQHDYGVETDAAIDRSFTLTDARWYGINQYFIYDMTPTTSIGFRFEWFGDPENARVLGVPIESQTDGGNYYAASVGLNWKPCDRVVLRPELRWDWSDVSVPGVANGMYDDFSDKNQFTLGTDLIVTF